MSTDEKGRASDANYVFVYSDVNEDTLDISANNFFYRRSTIEFAGKDIPTLAESLIRVGEDEFYGNMHIHTEPAPEYYDNERTRNITYYENN